MARPRSPNREKAFEEERGGTITNCEIEALLNEDEKVIVA